MQLLNKPVRDTTHYCFFCPPADGAWNYKLWLKEVFQSNDPLLQQTNSLVCLLNQLCELCSKCPVTEKVLKSLPRSDVCSWCSWSTSKSAFAIASRRASADSMVFVGAWKLIFFGSGGLATVLFALGFR